jgi:hypothetical protein
MPITMLVQIILKWLPQKLTTVVVNIISQMLCYRKFQNLYKIQYIKFPIIILPIFPYLRQSIHGGTRARIYLHLPYSLRPSGRQTERPLHFLRKYVRYIFFYFTLLRKHTNENTTTSSLLSYYLPT